MNTVLGIAVSFAFVFLVIGCATLLSKRGAVSAETSRKIIHIGVSNWWFIAVLFFDSWQGAIAVPAVFVVLNAISYRKHIFSAMERGAGARDLGTVYYAISLVILAALTFAAGKPWIGGIGILAMGWGDGLAAVAGIRYPKPKLPFSESKSVAGSTAVFIMTFAVAALAFRFGLGFDWSLRLAAASLACAFGAALLEAVSPLGFDNLTLPLGTSAIAWLFAGYPA